MAVQRASVSAQATAPMATQKVTRKPATSFSKAVSGRAAGLCMVGRSTWAPAPIHAYSSSQAHFTQKGTEMVGVKPMLGPEKL